MLSFNPAATCPISNLKCPHHDARAASAALQYCLHYQGLEPKPWVQVRSWSSIIFLYFDLFVHSVIRVWIDSFIYWPYLSIHQFINSFIHSYLYLLIDLFEGLFIFLFTCISIYVFICARVYLLNYLFICLLLYVFNVHLRGDVCVCRVGIYIYCLCVHPTLNTCSL